ncbi:MAG: AAA family ATPase [Paludibacteraceae bacterium]|nr:AAA family ATPase [Paludibacteraceae bacterium]
MRILKLEIKNLASLDRECGEVIDFEDGALKNSSIFSIVGPTGSGKSTILDAICLALYNRAPRYPRKKGEAKQIYKIYGATDEENQNSTSPLDCRNILSNGKKEGYSKLTFLANNGFVYRAEWSVRFGKIYYQDSVTTLIRLTSDNGITKEEIADWNSIPMIIGLEYEQFLRTVLIPQGAFATFLAGDEKERFRLLEKLIGSEEMYKNIAAGIKAEKEKAVEEFNTLNTQCSVNGQYIIPAEELSAIETRIEELRKEEESTREELKRIAEALLWHQAEKENAQRVESAKKDVKDAQQLVDSVASDKEYLTLHDVTTEAVSLYKEGQEANAMIAKCNRDLDALGREKEQIVAKISTDEQRAEILRQETENAVNLYETQKPHINEARRIKVELENAEKTRIERLTARDNAKKANDAAQKALDDNRKLIAEAEKELADAVRKRDELRKTVEDETKRLSDKAKIDREAFESENGIFEAQDAKKLQDAKSNAEGIINDLNSAIKTETQRIAKKQEAEKNNNTLDVLTLRNEEIEKELRRINVVELELELETLRKTQTLMTSEDWVLHRQNLKEGDQCPLCGATVHPFCNSREFDIVINELSDIVIKKQEAVREAHEKINRLTREQGKNNGQISTINATNLKLQKELDMLNAEWVDVRKRHGDWSEDVEGLTAMKTQCQADVDEATRNLDLFNQLAKRVRELRSFSDKSDKALSDYTMKSTADINAANEKVNNAATKWETEKGKTENLDRQLAEKCQTLQEADRALKSAETLVAERGNALYDEIGDNDPETMDKRLAEEVRTRQNREATHREVLAKLRENLKMKEGQIESTNDSLNEMNEKQNRVFGALDGWIYSYNLRNEKQLSKDVIAQLFADNRDWELLRKKISDIDNNLTAKRSALEVAVNTYDKHQESKPEHTESELTNRQIELNGRDNEELTTLKARKRNHDDASAALGELLIKTQNAENLKKEWEEISKAVGANEGETLRKIAQCYTLRFLVEHANAEIRKFNDRYELVQVKNSLGLRVIDHNRADVVRETTSLSGGETFIVSLGLALGLSSLSSRNVHFENLFIDEGFGTLDPETLTTVIESLRMLQSSQGKKVCIISHTEKMRESIPTQIQLIKDGENGSSHIRIYPY